MIHAQVGISPLPSPPEWVSSYLAGCFTTCIFHLLYKMEILGVNKCISIASLVIRDFLLHECTSVDLTKF